MTKGERAALLRGINPLTGQPFTRTATAPAAATALPAWVAEAKTAVAQAPVPVPQDRPWTFVRVEPTNSGNGRDKAIFQSVTKNGGTFESTVPGDLVRAIRAGKVIGLK